MVMPNCDIYLVETKDNAQMFMKVLCDTPNYTVIAIILITV